MLSGYATWVTASQLLVSSLLPPGRNWWEPGAGIRSCVLLEPWPGIRSCVLWEPGTGIRDCISWEPGPGIRNCVLWEPGGGIKSCIVGTWDWDPGIGSLLREPGTGLLGSGAVYRSQVFQCGTAS